MENSPWFVTTRKILSLSRYLSMKYETSAFSSSPLLLMIAWSLLSRASYSLTIPVSVYSTLGYRILDSLGLSSRYRAVFFNPYVVFDAKSMTPVTGLTTNPARPWAVPLKNPRAPSFFVLYIGLRNKPVIPSLKPLKTAFPPFSKPSKTCFGFFIFSLSLICSNYLSNVSAASPEAIVPVTF